MGEMRNTYEMLVEKLVGKTPLRIIRRRWKEDIKMDLKTKRVGMYGLDSLGSGYGPAVGFCEHGTEHSGSMKGG
jgi:hypothetical protein